MSEYVKEVFQVIQNSGLKFELGGMSTSIEASSFEEIYTIISHARERLLQKGAQRIIVDLKIDDRHDKDARINLKKRSLTDSDL